jgi:hypothetical protein
VDARHLFTNGDLALLGDWLNEGGQLLLYIYWPHQAGANAYHFFRSLAELRSILVSQDAPEIELMIFRNSRFVLRDTVTDEFITKVLREYATNLFYTLIGSPNHDSTQWHYLSDGQTTDQLKADLDAWKDTEVAVVVDLTDRSQQELGYRSHEYVLYIRVLRNQNSYLNYSKHPEKYTWVQEARRIFESNESL